MDSLIEEVRKKFVFGMNRLEQASLQRKPISPVERREQELKLAEEIINLVKQTEK